MDEAGSGLPGSGDCCHFCTVPDSAGQVPAIAVGYAAANAGATAGHAPAAAPHAATATWVYAACCDSYWGSTATAFTPACSAYHHFDDSSSIAQWASELGIASSSVCLSHSTGVSVVILASSSPTVHTISYGLLTGSVILAICA